MLSKHLCSVYKPICLYFVTVTDDLTGSFSPPSQVTAHPPGEIPCIVFIVWYIVVNYHVIMEKMKYCRLNVVIFPITLKVWFGGDIQTISSCFHFTYPGSNGSIAGAASGVAIAAIIIASSIGGFVLYRYVNEICKTTGQEIDFFFLYHKLGFAYTGWPKNNGTAYFRYSRYLMTGVSGWGIFS